MATAIAAINVRRLGVLGGTFDPVHRAHIALALAAKNQLNLDEVRLMPCGNPPHRDLAETSDADRLAMLNLAANNHADLVVDDWELGQHAVTYTYKTLEHLAGYEGQQLFFLMGLDSLQQFTTWRHWQRILELCHLAVVRRPDTAREEIPGELKARMKDVGVSLDALAGNIYLVDFDEMPISATEIRRQLKAGVVPADTIDPAVLGYILEKRLYQNV